MKMMKITSMRYGTEEQLVVTPDQVFEFYPGLGGFEQYHRYALIAEEDSPIEWLQAVDDPEVVFALIEPFLCAPDYAFELPDADVVALGLQHPGEALVRCILALRSDPEEITANMLAPLVLNPQARVGRQVVLQDSDWPLRLPVFDAVRALAQAADTQGNGRASSSAA